MSGSITEINHNTSSIFNTAAFRRIIAKEFRLQECLIELSLNNQGDCLFPSFIKRKILGKDHLIIGAAFDKTGEHSLYHEVYFPELINSLLSHQTINRFKTIELRTKHKLVGHQDYADKVELGIHLQEGIDQLWSKLSRNTRKNIRRPLNQGFTYRCGNSPVFLDEFYTLYLKSMHSLGSLVHSKTFFQSLLNECNSQVLIFIGYLDDKPVIASFNFICESELYGAWSGFDPNYKQHNIFIAMLWSLTEYAASIGITYYNLGRSSLNSNQYHFKQKIANHEQKIYYYQLKPIQIKTTHPIYNTAASIIKKSPPLFMHVLSRLFLGRFY